MSCLYKRIQTAFSTGSYKCRRDKYYRGLTLEGFTGICLTYTFNTI